MKEPLPAVFGPAAKLCCVAPYLFVCLADPKWYPVEILSVCVVLIIIVVFLLVLPFLGRIRSKHGKHTIKRENLCQMTSVNIIQANDRSLVLLLRVLLSRSQSDSRRSAGQWGGRGDVQACPRSVWQMWAKAMSFDFVLRGETQAAHEFVVLLFWWDYLYLVSFFFY